ncbi:MAG: S41 family peptidase [Candidatus Moraniibacteriota bacterium]
MQNSSGLKFKKPTWRRHFVFYLVILGIVASFGAGLVVGEETVRKSYLASADQNKFRENVNLDIVFEAWKKLNDKYVGSVPDNKTMVYGMTKGLANSLGDPYTVFFEPEKAKQFKEDLKGSFSGIGAEIGMKQNILTVVAPIKDTPADKAGIKAGDKIFKIDDTDTAGLAVDEAVALIRGERGTKVKLLLMSEEDSLPREVEIIRDIINVKSVDWELKENDIAYIRLSGFTEDAVKEFSEAAGKVKESPAKKIVLDLRGNPGGYLDAAVDIAGFFLPKDTLVVREDFGGKHPANDYKTQYKPVLGDYPLVILIDKGSASASEILAGAISEQKGVQLVGEQTFGKGSVQEFISLSDGSTIKVTVAEWLTPKGKSINKEGIKADIEVKITADDIKDKKDPQLDKAMEIIKDK